MFADRSDAAEKLAAKLTKYRAQPDTLILGLPRGGVEIAYYLAKSLSLPFDIIITRKIGAWENPEFALAAVGLHTIVFNPEYPSADNQYINSQITLQRQEIKRREKLYRPNRKPLKLSNKTIILCDDGIATGLTALAALRELRFSKPKKIILAVPVAAPTSLEALSGYCDEIFTLETPEVFFAVGQFYLNFPQVSDQEVIAMMTKS